MAIHPEVPGLTVCIEVDRRDLPEYDGEDGQDTSPGIVTKHIEAISGATFNISVRFNPGIFQYANQAVVVTVNCDGHPMSQTEFWAGYIHSHRSSLIGYWVGTGRDGQRVERELVFSDLTIRLSLTF